MPHRPGRKDEGRARILGGAARGFRRHGFGGVGVDGLAKEAGVTSGAFYAHFRSKADAFRETVVEGLQTLQAGIAACRAQGGAWRARFAAFYLGPNRRCELAESCALQSLTAEVARADDATRAAFEAELRRVVAAMEDAPAFGRADAIALLALLSGGVTLARAVADPELAEEIAAAVRAAAARIG